MKYVIKYGVVLGVLALAAALWADSFELTTGAVLLVPAGLVGWFLERRSADAQELEEEDEPGVARPFVHGLMVGALAAGYLTAGTALARRTVWSERDLASLHAELGELCGKDQHASVSSRVRERLEGSLSELGRRELAGVAVRCYVHAGDQQADPEAARREYLAGIELATAGGADSTGAKKALVSLDDESTLRSNVDTAMREARWPEALTLLRARTRDGMSRTEAWRVPAQTRVCDAALAWLGSLSSPRERLDAVADVRAEIDACDEHRAAFEKMSDDARNALHDSDIAGTLAKARDLAYAQREVERLAREEADRLRSTHEQEERKTQAERDSLRDQALAEPDLQRRRELLGALIAMAPNASNAPELRELLGQTERDLEALAREHEARKRAQEPRPLEPGSSGGLVAIHTANLPTQFEVDLWAVDPVGLELRGLEAKDFTALLGGVPVESVRLVRIASPEAARRDIVLVVDVSGSTSGAPIAASILSGKAFLTRAPSEHTYFEALAFSSDVRTLFAWTRDPASQAHCLDTLKASGGTKLYAALDRAIADLAGRPAADRRIVLFSDGDDEGKGRSNEAAVLANARKAEVKIHSIGLKSKDFDAQALARLAEVSGGSFATTQSSSELSTLWARLGHELHQPRIRLLLTLPPGADHDGEVSLEIAIGGANAIRLTRPVQFPPPVAPRGS